MSWPFDGQKIVTTASYIWLNLILHWKSQTGQRHLKTREMLQVGCKKSLQGIAHVVRLKASYSRLQFYRLQFYRLQKYPVSRIINFVLAEFLQESTHVWQEAAILIEGICRYEGSKRYRTITPIPTLLLDSYSNDPYLSFMPASASFTRMTPSPFTWMPSLSPPSFPSYSGCPSSLHFPWLHFILCLYLFLW
jgi:hypothetical protein